MTHFIPIIPPRREEGRKTAGSLFIFLLIAVCIGFFCCIAGTYAADHKEKSYEKETTDDGLTVLVTDVPEQTALDPDRAEHIHLDAVTIDTNTLKVKTGSGKTTSMRRVFGTTTAEEKELSSGDRKEKHKNIKEYLEKEELYIINDSEKNKITVSFPFAYKRIIVFSRQKSLKNSYGAVKACYYVTGEDYLLDYKSEEDAKEAYKQLVKDFGKKSVIPDIPIRSVDDQSDFKRVQAAGSGEAFSQTSSLSHSWGVDMMQLDAIRDSLNNDASITNSALVAVLDTGIYSDHELFRNRIADGAASFITEKDGSESYDDQSGHGTLTAGIVADGTPNRVRILPVKVLNADGQGSIATIINGLRYVSSKHPDVVNMSFDVLIDNLTYDEIMGDYTILQYEAAFRTLKDDDCLNIVAAGNNEVDVDQPGSYVYPAMSRYAVTVSSIDEDKSFSSWFSNYGSSIDFAAPGEDITGASIEGPSSYRMADGTSVSAPHVSAACAVLKLLDNKAQYDQTMNNLIAACEDLGAAGKDSYYGNGLIRLTPDTLRSLRVSRTIEITWNDFYNKQDTRAMLNASIYNKKNPALLLATVSLNSADNSSNVWENTVSDLPEFNADGSRAEYEWIVSPPKCYKADSGTKDRRTTRYTLTLHHDLVEIPARAATEDADGNIMHYKCRTCGRLFSDSSGSNMISQADTMIARLPRISLSAYNKSIALKKGGKKTVTIYVTPKEYAHTLNQKPKVTSSKAKVASVSGIKLSGSKLTFKVKGKKAGTTTITVRLGNKTTKVKVKVVKKANPARELKASKKKASVKVSKTTKLVVKITPADKQSICTDPVKASSKNTATAVVSSISVAKGKATITVKGKKKGKTSIQVTVGKKKTRISLTVK